MRYSQRVAGVSFYQSAVRECSPLDQVTLVPEPENVHDPNAIKVMVNDIHHVGYIPRNDTDGYHALLQKSQIQRAYVRAMEAFTLNDGREIVTVEIAIVSNRDVGFKGDAALPEPVAVASVGSWRDITNPPCRRRKGGFIRRMLGR
jgi:hypothetical protein